MTKKERKKEENSEDLIENSDVKESRELENNINSEEVNLTENKPEEVQNPIEVNKKQNKQMIWAVILMVSIILIILLTPYVIKNYINKFTYSDLDFYKTKMGQITFYSTSIPLTDSQMNLISEYPINFRNDPRKLEKIPYEFPDSDSVLNDDNNDSSQIVFKKFQTVYISLQSDAPRCEDNIIAIVAFTQFLKGFANMSVKAATDNKSYANETGYPYVTCQNHPTNTVIHIVSKNSTKITKVTDNCYELEYANCEIMPVTEKFMIEIIKGYMNVFMQYFKKYNALGLKS